MLKNIYTLTTIFAFIFLMSTTYKFAIYSNNYLSVEMGGLIGTDAVLVNSYSVDISTLRIPNLVHKQVSEFSDGTIITETVELVSVEIEYIYFFDEDGNQTDYDYMNYLNKAYNGGSGSKIEHNILNI